MLRLLVDVHVQLPGAEDDNVDDSHAAYQKQKDIVWDKRCQPLLAMLTPDRGLAPRSWSAMSPASFSWILA